MSVLARVRAGMLGFQAGWTSYSEPPVLDQEGRYSLLWSFYQGDWRGSAEAQQNLRRRNPKLYKNTRQLLKATDAIVSLYDQYVYAGDLSSDGKPLPDGTRGAIPIDPQTPSKVTNEQLIVAIHQLWAIWSWRENMSMMPKYAAILGDVLVELIADLDRGVVMPRFVWPGLIPDQDLVIDDAGNVKQYAIEYDVEVPARTGQFGVYQQATAYRFRKEVDSQWIRYYKDGQPHDYTELGKTRKEENPYGFCPAIWCRHEKMIDSNRGIGAFEKTLLSAMELNSTLSAAMDYSVKQFKAPVGVVDGDDQVLNAMRGRTITLPGGTVVGGTPIVDSERAKQAARRAQAENLDLLPMGPQGKFVTVAFDLGGADKLIDRLLTGMENENPESQYGAKLLEIKDPSSPGVNRVLSPIVGRVKNARKNHDPQMVKASQMGVSMMAHHLKAGDFPLELVSARASRYKAFEPYDLGSYGRGLLDCTIPDRDVFSDTPAERVQYLVMAESLKTRWAMLKAGIPEEDADAILKEREAQMTALADATLADDVDAQDAQDDANTEQRPAKPQPRPAAATTP